MRKIGIDGNRPLDGTGNISPTIQPDLIAATGTGYVRVNFVRGIYDSPRDADWLNRFDNLIDGLRARGVQIYGLIGHESVPGSPGDNCRDGAPNGAAEAWVREYVDIFDFIVEHFQGRVEFFETFNEPNDWHGQPRPWIHPYWMAKMLRDIYYRVKIQNKRQATIISCPVFTHYQDKGDYINGFYTEGKNQHDWNGFRAQHGTFPLDGIGAHIYLESEKDTASTARVFKARVDHLWNIVTRHEGADTPKRLFISEFGWQSHDGEGRKARHIETALPLLRNDWRVRLAILFCVQGWREPAGEKRWGIYKLGSLDPGNREEAYEVFKAQTALDKAQPGTTARPGEEKIARVQKQWWQSILDRYFASNAQMKTFLGNSVPGGFLAQDGNRIEFFQNGGLIVRPNGDVTMAPIGAWIAEEYRRKEVPEFQWAKDRGGDNRYFEDTMHNLFGDFKAAWKGMYGKPVSEEFYLVLGGKAATCQMFEFAMMMHNPNTNQFELVQGRLSEIFLSMIEGGEGLGIIGRLVQRQTTRAVRALGEEPEEQLEGAPLAIPRKAEVPQEEAVAPLVPKAPTVAAPSPELPGGRITLRNRADILSSLEVIANSLLSGAIDIETAESLVEICVAALEIM